MPTKKINVPEPVACSVADLKPHPENYRNHPDDQIEHIAASIKENGFYRNIVAANDGTILAGHGVWLAAQKIKMKTVPVVSLVVPPDHPTAIKILVADNTLGLFAEDDDRALSDMLKHIADESDLLGTGFDEQMLAALAMVTRPASEIADKNAAAEWVGMPDFVPPDGPYALHVVFDTDAEREQFANEHGMGGDGSHMKREKNAWIVRWPLQQKDDVKSVMYEEHDRAG